MKWPWVSVALYDLERELRRSREDEVRCLMNRYIDTLIKLNKARLRVLDVEEERDNWRKEAMK